MGKAKITSIEAGRNKKKAQKTQLKRPGDLNKAVQAIRELPVPVVLSSLELQIQVLKERGIEIVDWDDKTKTLEQFRIIGGKAYFLALHHEDREPQPK